MAHSYKTIANYPDLRRAVVDVICDAAYPANGYILDPTAMGFLTIDSVDPVVSTGEGVSPMYTAATAKLKMVKTGAGLSGVLVEIANTDVTANTKIRCDVTGNPRL